MKHGDFPLSCKHLPDGMMILRELMILRCTSSFFLHTFVAFLHRWYSYGSFALIRGTWPSRILGAWRRDQGSEHPGARDGEMFGHGKFMCTDDDSNIPGWWFGT